MIGFFIPLAEALVGGYLAAVAIYALLLILITRLGRRVLLHASVASSTYTALHALTWCAAAIGGTYICCLVAPLAPYGLLAIPLCLAAALALVVLRSFLQLPGQMSLFALLFNLAGIFGGTFATLHFCKVFAALHS